MVVRGNEGTVARGAVGGDGDSLFRRKCEAFPSGSLSSCLPVQTLSPCFSLSISERGTVRFVGDAAKGPRLSFFGGKGGVGKTSCAAAAAVRAATEGARVLVVSTDPAHSLSDALGLELGSEPRPVRDVGGRGELWAAELDADKALSRWLRERQDAIRTIADRGTYLDEEDIDRFLSLSFPGVDELVGLVELMRLSRSRELDHVVVDTAPTGHTLRLLEMPATLKRVAEVLDDMHAKHRFMASSIAGSWQPDAADEVIAEIEREAVELRRTLTDPARASFTWVTLPEELSVREAEDGVRAIEALGIEVSPVVVNRVWPAPERPCPLCTPRVDGERRWRERVAELFEDKVLLEVPARREEPRGVRELLDLAMSVKYLDLRRPRRTARARAPVFEPPPIEDARTIRFQGASSPIAPTARLVFFGGKGGVGKTTAAAACAIELAEARPRDRVLLLSTDPAHSLGDALDVEVGDEPRSLPGGPRNLMVRELDAAKAWEAERERYRNAVEDLFSSIFRGRMDATFDRRVLEDLVDLAPPGIDELFAIVTMLDAVVGPPPSIPPEGDGESAGDPLALPPLSPEDTVVTGDDVRATSADVWRELASIRVTGDDATVAIQIPSVPRKGSRRTKETKPAPPRAPNRPPFDLVVVDTAPAGHTLRLLALPEKALEWVHALMSVILKYRSVVGLGEFASDLTQLARRLRTLIQMLSDPSQCAFVIVSRPAELPRLETERLAKELRRLRVPVAAIVANGVTEPSCARCSAAAAAEEAELERLERLARLAARSPRLLTAPAVYPGPRGVVGLGLWRIGWTERVPAPATSSASVAPRKETDEPRHAPATAPRVPDSTAPPEPARAPVIDQDPE